jgi:hypothetical protein
MPSPLTSNGKKAILALEHLLQALFALNRAYFPSRKRSLERIRHFSARPADCEQRLLEVVALGSSAETLDRSRAAWQALVQDLAALAAQRPRPLGSPSACSARPPGIAERLLGPPRSPMPVGKTPPQVLFQHLTTEKEDGARGRGSIVPPAHHCHLLYCRGSLSGNGLPWTGFPPPAKRNSACGMWSKMTCHVTFDPLPGPDRRTAQPDRTRCCSKCWY